MTLKQNDEFVDLLLKKIYQAEEYVRVTTSGKACDPQGFINASLNLDKALLALYGSVEFRRSLALYEFPDQDPDKVLDRLAGILTDEEIGIQNEGWLAKDDNDA